MTTLRSFIQGTALVFVGACGADGVCVTPPCALTHAVVVNISSSVAGRTPDSAFVVVNGSPQGGCSASSAVPGSTEICAVFGGPGKYELDIGAPGFQTVHRTANITAYDAPKCGCVSVETANLTVVLVPTPSGSGI